MYHSFASLAVMCNAAKLHAFDINSNNSVFCYFLVDNSGNIVVRQDLVILVKFFHKKITNYSDNNNNNNHNK